MSLHSYLKNNLHSEITQADRFFLTYSVSGLRLLNLLSAEFPEHRFPTIFREHWRSGGNRERRVAYVDLGKREDMP